MADATTGVQARETHSGVVISIGERTYKLKKAVDLGFLDFRSREQRQAVCRREVELNRRLAPDVYLGVADVHGPDGELCDHLVVMRRLPAERSLAALVEAGEAVEECLDDVAGRLAAFHAEAQRSSEIAEQARVDAWRQRWRANLDALDPFRGELLDPELVDDIDHRARTFLNGRAALFDERVDQDRVVDGHGDLSASDVFCLEDGPRLLDCVEFDDQLRYVDGADDAATLAMHLQSGGRDDLAEQFLCRYGDHADDPLPRPLIEHYVAYRALIRTKAACLRWAQSNHDQTDAQQAHQLLELAHRRLRAATVRLILVGGAPGTGKSTISAALADRLGVTVLSSDRIRKELAGLDPDAPSDTTGAGSGAGGLYSAAHTDRTYQQLTSRAQHLLARGRSVVLDASWTRAGHRAGAARAAADAHAKLVALRCRTSQDTAAERIHTRQPGPSDADPQVAEQLASQADPWPEAYVVDTTGTIEDSITQAVEHVLG